MKYPAIQNYINGQKEAAGHYNRTDMENVMKQELLQQWLLLDNSRTDIR